MNGLLSMIGMQTELDYLMGDFAACFGGRGCNLNCVKACS